VTDFGLLVAVGDNLGLLVALSNDWNDLRLPVTLGDNFGLLVALRHDFGLLRPSATKATTFASQSPSATTLASLWPLCCHCEK
jgi:hypothetical protein